MAKASPITHGQLDRLALPAIIAGIAEPVISLVDTAFVGRLGTADLAAVGIASSFFLLVVWVLAQTRSAILAIVARYYGRQQLSEITDLVPIAIWMNFGLGVVFFAITSIFAEPIFRLYNADGEVLAKAVEYYRIRSMGHPIVLATFAISGVFRGLQNMSWSMWAGILGAAVNLVLDPLLIFGAFGHAGLGIAGSAWASLIAQLAMLGLSIHFLRKRTPFGILPTRWRHPEVRALAGLSGDLFLRTIALNVAYYLGNRYATGYGEAFIGTPSIALQIWLFSAFFIDGYAAAGSVLAGRLRGEGDTASLTRMTKLVVRRSVMIGALLSVLYLLGYEVIGHLFTEDPEVLKLFHGMFWMVVITQPLNAVAFALDGVYKGLGNGKVLRNTLMASTFLVFVPVAYMMDHLGWRLIAIWTAFLAWMLARSLLLGLHFRKHHGMAPVEAKA